MQDDFVRVLDDSDKFLFGQRANVAEDSEGTLEHGELNLFISVSKGRKQVLITASRLDQGRSLWQKDIHNLLRIFKPFACGDGCMRDYRKTYDENQPAVLDSGNASLGKVHWLGTEQLQSSEEK